MDPLDLNIRPDSRIHLGWHFNSPRSVELGAPILITKELLQHRGEAMVRAGGRYIGPVTIAAPLERAGLPAGDDGPR
jgi:hypothetical protein